MFIGIQTFSVFFSSTKPLFLSVTGVKLVEVHFDRTLYNAAKTVQTRFDTVLGFQILVKKHITASTIRLTRRGNFRDTPPTRSQTPISPPCKICIISPYFPGRQNFLYGDKRHRNVKIYGRYAIHRYVYRMMSTSPKGKYSISSYEIRVLDLAFSREKRVMSVPDTKTPLKTQQW